ESLFVHRLPNSKCSSFPLHVYSGNAVRLKPELLQPFLGDRDGLEFFVGTGKCYLVISNTGPTRHYRYYFDDIILPQNIIPNPQLLWWYHLSSFLATSSIYSLVPHIKPVTCSCPLPVNIISHPKSNVAHARIIRGFIPCPGIGSNGSPSFNLSYWSHCSASNFNRASSADICFRM